MNPFSDLFRRPPTVQECALPPEPELQVPLSSDPNPRDTSPLYLIVAYWPDRKITYEKPLNEALELVASLLGAGATRVEVEPEWQGARLVAS